VHHFALAYLFMPSTDIYACPLAMSDGAARTLLDSGNRALRERVVPHLLARNPAEFWTSGQWMTETIGGSDVGRSETVARQDADGEWRLYGTKWFTSAAASQVALTLARPEGNGPGGRGLALFCVETRGADGRLRGIRVRRLKEKLGTRKLPTAELELDGTPATLVGAPRDGVRAITPVLNLTRAWNTMSAAALMRRGLALARDYAHRRTAFGAPLVELPLHLDTLAGLEAEFEGALQLTFRLAELIGRAEVDQIDEPDARLLRLLTPLAKLTTGRQVVAVVSECLEAVGGQGYIEDTGLPVLLRDAQVLPIWEGTTNVLSLDALRALDARDAERTLAAEVERSAAAVRDADLQATLEAARAALTRAAHWRATAAERAGSDDALQAGARRWALTAGRALALALLCEQAQWTRTHESEERAAAAARRFAAAGVDLIAADVAFAPDDAALLVHDDERVRTRF
jgi:alkylation response protein AidB-like acyl-CoA dehydrogenase